jgi:hypothetical protein
MQDARFYAVALPACLCYAFTHERKKRMSGMVTSPVYRLETSAQEERKKWVCGKSEICLLTDFNLFAHPALVSAGRSQRRGWLPEKWFSRRKR